MSYRIDVSKIDGPSVDVNGFLTARAKLTRTGVFPYLTYDGTISYELRHPDDVFDPESLKSAQSQVVTNDHPPTMLYADNCKEYGVGFTGEIVEVVENKYIESNIKVTDEKTISDVMQGGKTQFSEGYRCDVVEESGIYDGIQYNARQKNIRYNHAAIVWEGRAGPDVSMKMDGADKDFAVMKLDSKNNCCKEEQLKVQLDSKSNISEKKNMKEEHKHDAEMKKCESCGQMIKGKGDALDFFQKELQDSKDSVSKAQAKADALQAEIEKRDSEIASLKADLSDDAILARADSLIKTKEFIKEILGEDKKDSIDKLKKQVVAKSGIDCSKKDSVYVDAAFETLMLTHKKEVKKDALAEIVGDASDKKIDSVDDKIKAHMDALQNRWKKK